MARKHEQATREKWDQGANRILEGYRSLMIFGDVLLNSGKHFNDLAPKLFNEMVEAEKEKEEKRSIFVSGSWWKPINESLPH